MPPLTPSAAAFVDRFPVFSSVAYLSIDAQLALSAMLLDSTAWGDFWEEAVFLDTAHEISIEQSASAAGVQGGLSMAGGPISSVSAAGVSVSMGTPMQSAKGASVEWYIKTIYGQKFLRLRASVLSPGFLSA